MLHATALSLHRGFADVTAAIRAALDRREPIRPLVFVYVEGETLDGSRKISNGASLRVIGKEGVCTLATHAALKNVRITAFCDPENIVVRSIRLGVRDLAAGFPGESPTAYADEWPMGVRLMVHIENQAFSK